jgi:hydrogenase maturation factor
MTNAGKEHCLTCSDEATLGVVAFVEGTEAVVCVTGAKEARVAIDLIPDVAAGDVLLCHAGIALDRLETGAQQPGISGAL